MLVAILKSTGQYNKIIEYAPIAVDVLLESERGQDVLRNLGILGKMNELEITIK